MRTLHLLVLSAAAATLLGCSSPPVVYPPGRELLPEPVEAPAGASTPEEAFARLQQVHTARDYGAYFDLLASDVRRRALHLCAMGVVLRIDALEDAGGDGGEHTFLEILEASEVSADFRTRWREARSSGDETALLAVYDTLVPEVGDFRRCYVGCLRLMDLQTKQFAKQDAKQDAAEGDTDWSKGDPCALFSARGWTLVDRVDVDDTHATLRLAQREGDRTRELNLVDEGKGWLLITETLRYIDTSGAAEAELERTVESLKRQ